MEVIMKNIVILILLITATAGFCQRVSSTVPNWSQIFNFGGIEDLMLQMASNGTDIFVSGVKSNGSPTDVYAVMAKFNLQHQMVWEARADTAGFGLSSSYSTIAATPDGGCIWSINRIPSTAFEGIVKLDSSGRKEWQFPCYEAVVQTKGDSIFVVIPQAISGLVLILDKNGKILIQYTLPFNVIDPHFTIVGNKMFLISKDTKWGVYSSLSGYVAELDWQTGQKHWSIEFPDIAKLYGSTDDSGNTFIAATTITTLSYDTSLVILAYLMSKIDANGNIKWQKIWAPRKSAISNQNNWAHGIVLDKIHRMAVLYGAIQRDEGENDGYKNYYAYGRDMETGDSLWCIDSVFASGTITSQFNGGVLLDNNQLVLMGDAIFNLAGNPPDRGYLIGYDIITPVTEHSPSITTTFTLSQNYPNPFNPTTNIVYTVPHRAHIKLTVYNILGEEVATLVDEEKASGEYTVTFDGSRLPSGVYFYRLHAGRFNETREMVLVK
jgi:hypothetical protein